MVVTAASSSYKGHRYPPEIIAHCVWLYHRFPLSFREVEELMLQRGVVVSYETIRLWCAKFGQAYANRLRRRRARPGDKWHLDEVFIRINGTIHYLWRAVDQHGNVLDILVQPRRNALAAKKFFRKLLKGLQYVPRVIVTDGLSSYRVAHRELMPSVAAPPVEVSEQSSRELPSTDPATRAGDETVHLARGMRNGSCPRSAASRHIFVPACICCRRPISDTRWPTASPCGTRSPGRPRPPPERELGQGVPPEPTHNTRTTDPNHQAHQLT